MSDSGFPLPRKEGRVTRQAHADLPEGTYEREIGANGFYGRATHMYHVHPPTGWTHFEGPLRPRAFDTTRFEKHEPRPFDAPVVLSNRQLRMRVWKTDAAMNHLARNADGDELLFVHEGSAELFCDYGHLSLRDGDYVVLPRGTLWRVEPHGQLSLLMIEASGARLRLPDRGPLGAHAVFDPAVLDVPSLDDAFEAQRSEDPWRIEVKARGVRSTLEYPWNPLDAIGWKGDLVPVRLNWRDIRPVTSARYHLPPSVHTTFVADRFVVCTFCPRPLETDPGALRVPFYHSNDDYDEVIFYHRGSFFSRDDIHPGMITFHPAGFSHGPHPKAREASRDLARTETDEVAVMLDARDALDVSRGSEAVERSDYADSWRE